MLIAGTREFFRSRAGRGFLVYVLLCAAFSAAIGYGVHQSNLRWFESSKSEEKRTALELAESFFATYSDLRAGFSSDEAPVPAVFRAHAIERFNAGRDPGEAPRLALVGVPGRAIRIAPGDDDMAEAVRAMAASADPRPTTRRVAVADQPMLRSMHPSVATQPSCVECHNRLQPGESWKLNEVMGAFVFDVPLAAFLRETQREAALIAVAAFVMACGLGLYVFLLQFRAVTSEIYTRLNDAVENLTDGFAIYDAQGHLVLSNPAHRLLAKFAGLKRVPSDSDMVPRMVSQEVQLPGGRWLDIREIHTRSGDVVCVETDISVLKRRESELRAAKNEAERANRAKSEFLALMSHELRTPLNAIIGFSDVIGRQMLGTVDGRYRSCADDINQSGQHLLAVINDILDLAKVEAGKVTLAEQRVSLADAVQASCRLINQQAVDAGLTLSLDVPAHLILMADPVRLKQIVLNLISNGVKFTPSGGQVSISAALTADGAAALTVADTGIGMSAAEIPRALAAFEQVDSRNSRRYGGTGLGLPIAKLMAEAHGGTLSIESELGRGTRVTITFPPGRVIRQAAVAVVAPVAVSA